MLSQAAVLFRIALANIFSSMLNLFVGLVLLLGSALLVIGGSLFTTLDEALSKSIIGSITGHLQVYSARSKDPLEVYGKVDGSDSQLSPLEDFKALKQMLLSLPNVERVVPMGTATSMLSSGNTIDVTLERLRTLIRDGHSLAPEDAARQKASLVGHVRNMVAILNKDLEREKELTDDKDLDANARTILGQASSEEFWATFDGDPLGHLEFLENRLAPLVSDSDLLFIRYLGTDLDAYQATFDRMKIVEGTQVPTGQRGILLPRYFMEEMLKLKNARRLDKIRDALAAGRKLSDQSDKELQRFVKENQVQTREFVLQLDGLSTAVAIQKLQTHLNSAETDFPSLLTEFFSVNDANFESRYQFFYQQLAPMLSLYRVKVGDTMTLKSFGRSGSLQSALVKVYGVFELNGLEKSPLAGANALIDLITFRELYGFLTAEKKAELDAMKAQSGATEVQRETAEAELFGSDAELVQTVEAKAFADDVTPRDGPSVSARRLPDHFTAHEVDDGVVIHAAIWLKDGSPLQQLNTQRVLSERLAAQTLPPKADQVAAAKTVVRGGQLEVRLAELATRVVNGEEARLNGGRPVAIDTLLELQGALKSERANLNPSHYETLRNLLDGAKPPTLAVSWNSAAGFLGKFIDFFRLMLLAIVAAFAFFALIIVTIGMTIATLQRTSTIGTMRAIGAQRSFVFFMVLIETVLLALSFGAAGAAVGAAVVKYLHVRGIPAFRDELYFFFSGPVLRPELTVGGVLLSVVVTLVVSVLAVLFPLVLATRVSPITAMQSSEA
jgi:ABC-type lipoprotein release transport system permease subunit